jgi:SAM-dependent methyltransferase
MTDSRAEIAEGSRFAFGANWESFAGLVDEARIDSARQSMSKALGITDLADRRFVDVGCGSGLFSLAAHRLGATVHSFDFDSDSVQAATSLRTRFAPNSDWVIEPGSILDAPYVAQLGHFDVVYSWGVLHHTGDLYRAIAASASLVADRGLLFVSIYNDQGFESRAWRWVKRRYNKSGRLGRGVLVVGSAVYLGRRRPMRAALSLPARSKAAARPGRDRGMSARHDMVDWVGGYPFEVAKPEEIFAAVAKLGFELRYLKTCGGGIGCNEYVFERVPLGGPAGRPELRDPGLEQAEV